MTSPDRAQPPRWTLTYGADLAIRVWDDACLVHHALSNDTHRLSAWLVPALHRLGEQPPAEAEELAELLDVEPDLAVDAMEQLERVLLVRRC